jgi:5-methyltetrahydropteroyltriglutamate--homocysteine methyltransferase
MSGDDRPPFRAEHVGSLLRPPELLEARRKRACGELAAEALREIEDAAIAEAVHFQQDLGLRVVTDGEMRRESWHMDFLYRIGGIEKVATTLQVRFRNESGDMAFAPPMPKVTGRLHLKDVIFADDFAHLRSIAMATPKLTIPSPNMIHYRGGIASVDPSAYPDLEGFWIDLSAVYAAEISALAARGCRYLQIDDTSLACINDPKQRDQLARLGGDPEKQHLTYIRVLNEALKNRPGDMTVATHMCRGNFRSSWTAGGGYDFVAEALFSELDVDAFFLEYDDARSGGFAPLRFVPKGKRVVLGLVTTKRGALEDKETLKRRIDEAARYLPLDQLCLSPQCGFSSTTDGNALTFDDQRRKLALVVETAAEVWRA